MKRQTPSVFAVLSLALAFLLAGCASTPDFPPAPVKADIVGAPDYLIGAGDGLDIQVWRNPEVSTSVTVRPDGKFNSPLVDDIVAANKTPTQLERDLEKHLAKFIQDPIVTVMVTGFIGPYSQQIRVIGQAAKPQALQYREKMSLMDVMIAVGGITDFAAGNDATIVRSYGGQQQQFSVRLEDLIRGGDISANVEMMPGDVLIIPESFF
ncbi:MAG: polysaccharide biosynthesis/export family protein [Hydrogenophilaceae bacterium]|jgi:polysaccharide export outer membrane protein|nr:polysaccharide biosynthesis/export family protein [Hydrogenophilaceae bacterium]